jgi:hypothetical protein
MKMKEAKVILYSDPDIVKFVTNVKGWIDNKGRFWGNDEHGEHMARYSSCTHKSCEKCGEIHIISGYCHACHLKKEVDRYAALPRIKWDGETPLYDEASDRWFFDADDIGDLTDEELAAARMVICEPVYAREIQEDYFCDELPNDCMLMDVDEKLADLIEVVNAYIRKRETPLSWTPGKFAVELEITP